MSPRISTYVLTMDSSLPCISHIASFRQNNLIAWKGRPRCLHLKTKRALNSLLLLLLLENSGKEYLMWMILFWLQKPRNYYWRRWGNGRRGWKRMVWEWMLEQQKSSDVRWARVRLRILDVVFAGRELVTTQSYSWSVLSGFIKDVREGKGRLGKNVWIITWKCLVYILNGGIQGCVEGLHMGNRLTLA